VQLVEIPTNDEIQDNIVAMWVPEAPVTAGSESHLRYRLHWVADEPYPPPLAKCVATRLGNGGQPGQGRKRRRRRRGRGGGGQPRPAGEAAANAGGRPPNGGQGT